METNPGEVTQLLKTMSRGDRKAAEALFALIYAELHPLVRAYMRPQASRSHATGYRSHQRGLVTFKHLSITRAVQQILAPGLLLLATTCTGLNHRLGKCEVRYCSWLAPAGRPEASNAFSASWRDVQPDHCVPLPVHSACTAT